MLLNLLYFILFNSFSQQEPNIVEVGLSFDDFYVLFLNLIPFIPPLSPPLFRRSQSGWFFLFLRSSLVGIVLIQHRDAHRRKSPHSSLLTSLTSHFIYCVKFTPIYINWHIFQSLIPKENLLNLFRAIPIACCSSYPRPFNRLVFFNLYWFLWFLSI